MFPSTADAFVRQQVKHHRQCIVEIYTRDGNQVEVLHSSVYTRETLSDYAILIDKFCNARAEDPSTVPEGYTFRGCTSEEYHNNGKSCPWPRPFEQPQPVPDEPEVRGLFGGRKKNKQAASTSTHYIETYHDRKTGQPFTYVVYDRRER
ncbi:hypothetical protein PspLS_07011 [Pyricularia sp. CBS 133598]|nr:hypothetical protein PspLS_07011 [Pyricularia sp. CBS 133598]